MEPNQMTIDAELIDSQVDDLNLGEVFEEEKPIAPWRLRMTRKLIDPILFGVMISINLVMTVIILLIQDYPVWTYDHRYLLTILGTVINFYFLVHALLFVTIIGPLNAWKDNKSLYVELVIQAIGIYYAFRSFDDTGLTQWYEFYSVLTIVILVRNFRAYYLFSEKESVQVINETTKHISKPVLG